MNPTQLHQSFVVAKRGVWTCSVCKNPKGRLPPSFSQPCSCMCAVFQELELPADAKPELVGKGVADAKARSVFPSPIASLPRTAVEGCVSRELEVALHLAQRQRGRAQRSNVLTAATAAATSARHTGLSQTSAPTCPPTFSPRRCFSTTASRSTSRPTRPSQSPRSSLRFLQ